MDTPQHIVWGVAGSTYFGLPIEQTIAVGAISVLPDAIGWVGLKRNESYSWYLFAHSWETTAYFGMASLAFLLAFSWWWLAVGWGAYALHILLDSFTHEKGREWWVWPQMMWVEILGWVLLTGYFLWLFLH